MTTPRELEEDERIWHFSRTREYTVRSAYRLYREKIDERPSQDVPGQWQHLWNLRLPPKMKHMLWRGCRGVLPTRNALKNRGVPVLDRCGLCDEEGETTIHLFRDCRVATECWYAGSEGASIHGTDSMINFEEWLSYVMNRRTTDQKQKVGAILWSIWRERNERIWRHTTRPPEEIIKQGEDEVSMWRRANESGERSMRARRSRCTKWHPPKDGALSCCVDVALFHDIYSYGVGGVLRTSSGEVRHLWQHRIPGCQSALEGEARAMLEAMRRLEQEGLERVILESDSQTLVHRLKQQQLDITELGLLLTKCREFLGRNLSWEVKFIRREQNRVAHELAARSRVAESSLDGNATPQWLDNLCSNVCHSLDHE